MSGLLTAFGLENQIKIDFDECNLQDWYHPGMHTIRQAMAWEDEGATVISTEEYKKAISELIHARGILSP